MDKDMIRMVRDYTGYDDYVKHQSEKTSSSRIRNNLLLTWNERVSFFQGVFAEMNISGRALCVGARMGHEVKALHNLDVDAIGIDLVPFRPLVIKGDMHDIPFGDNEFDFVFSNCFDHSLQPDKMISEIRRVLKPEGRVLLHLCVGSHGNYETLQIDDPDYLAGYFDDVVESCYMEPWNGMNYKFVANNT